MRVRTVSWLLAIAIAAPAHAAVLPFHATLEISIASNPAVIVTDSGVATLDGSGAGAHLTRIEFAAGTIAGTSLLPLTDPAAYPITGFRLGVANAGGAISETTGGALRGAMGLPGAVRVCLFGTGGCNMPVANVSVPLTPIGSGGFATATGFVNVSVFGAPWTTATAAYASATQMGWARGPASAPSSTAQPGGSLRLVTPVFITTNIGASVVLPAFAILTLHFVPEPATALLLGGGLAALLWRVRCQPQRHR